jgi:SagB-type dehydrogenase family enzyme
LARAYHDLTKHSLASLQAGPRELDWPNQPLPFKVYTSLEPLPLPAQLPASGASALEAIAGLVDPESSRVVDLQLLARLLYHANGITKLLRRPTGNTPFRAAACTGALYHIELYVICQHLPDLAAGVYHYAAHDHSLRLLRRGDYRAVLGSAAPATLALTSTWWRNAWKYRARAYRHSFWDSGTILANLLAVASAQRLPTRLRVRFDDAAANSLLDIDPALEAAICLASLGSDGTPPTPPSELPPLRLPTRALSPQQQDYPEIPAAHAATATATDWSPPVSDLPSTVGDLPPTPPIEQVITRRGSARRFSHSPISQSDLRAILAVATQPIAWDVPDRLTTPYLIVNAVEGVASGAYVYRDRQLHLLRPGSFREQAGFLDLGQPLAADAAVNVYSLCDLRAVLDRLGERGYRAAQLEGGIEGGRLYLAAYALGLGATGLTFFDDDVSTFFGVPDQAVMFLTAIGHPARQGSPRPAR